MSPKIMQPPCLYFIFSICVTFVTFDCCYSYNATKNKTVQSILPEDYNYENANLEKENTMENEDDGLEWYWKLLLLILAFVLCFAILYYGLKSIICTPSYGG